MSFNRFDFYHALNANIERMGYERPTPIQDKAMPAVIHGRDVMGLAQTGTGKTAAFMLPILDRLAKRPTKGRKVVRALVIAPTRELAEQINDAGRDLSKGTNIVGTTVYGGVGMQPQVNRLRRGVDVVTACPGRLLDHLRQGTVDLSHVETLVLDEADHMFDMGFLPDIRKILAALPNKRQTLLFSATMPEQVRALAGDTLSDPVTVRIGHCAPAETVDHDAYPVREHQKTPMLMALLDQARSGSVLVFTRTKHRAKRLAQQLERAGHAATSLQGNLSQNKRKAALDGFRNGRFRIMVATDIAARGIDISRVAHVINYDVPNTADAYTHRIGRTGRAERTGVAHSLITREDQGLVRAIERLMGAPLKRRTMDGFNYDTPAPARAAGGGQRNTGRPGGNRGGNGYGRPGGGNKPRRAGSGGNRRGGRPGQAPRSA